MTVVLNFDASTVKPSEPRGVIPTGDYNVCLVAAETKETNAKDGHYLALDYIVQDGEHAGRHIYDNLNLWNKSKEATKIAWEDMSALCHACSRLQVGEINELFGILFSATIGIDQGDEKYGPSNRVKSVQKITGAPIMPATAAPITSSPGEPPLDAAMPWNKTTAAPVAAPVADPVVAAPAPAPVAATPAPVVAPTPEPVAATPAPATTDKPPWAT